MQLTQPGAGVAEALSLRPASAKQQILGQSELQSEIIVSKQTDKQTIQSLLVIDVSVCKQKFHLNSTVSKLEDAQSSQGLIPT